MTRFTRISTLTMLAVLAGSTFVATAQAQPKKVWCEEASSILFRTACETQKRYYWRPPTDIPGVTHLNFRGRTNQELAVRAPTGGGNNGNGGGNGGKR